MEILRTVLPSRTSLPVLFYTVCARVLNPRRFYMAKQQVEWRLCPSHTTMVVQTPAFILVTAAASHIWDKWLSILYSVS